MNDAVINIGLVLSVVQVANYFKLDAPENILYIRIAYGVSQLVGYSIMAYVFMRVRDKNDKTALIYNESKNPFAPNESKVVTSTVGDYDKEQVKNFFTQGLTAVAILAFMHLKWGYLRPLFIQAIMSLRQLYSNPMFQIHVLGKPATDNLARPFKTGFGMASQTAGPTKKELKAQDRKAAKKKINRDD
ncbi:hypothetical protein BATDEDRAFT_23108 [Batrachochytrium dendrobatidis JAM81]|uniref:Inorganic phosphate transporter n=1 Tax=Batrachochytrium dendrobatidis (strain JAM81 / FGSC 10211) TaxID=684364 RepID=F4NWR5_BATDJ|nr:uncharacterized protein BATDEDRAFT_23108 [Batrachochytrium dendrobatidis JAM81]EGF82869.1 hypothetical protein BATDEDRAFT_23108 [Batrachochytrium dendrobatidis JAM81]KAJ8327935.1 phosphate transporter (Pho88) [Batrachochytrium dendrobatidis]KAK5667119.1 phosphate transporter (Pho88) [Batrachochytrium dendrobatidis]|eukprot:XP_006676706.1 hypothetical protein BATDEDRAFT_23108 [Batrachochytrium dendrobatidis JAM81]